MFRLAEFWVAVAFFVFIAGVLYYKVPAMLGKALDERADNIRKELDEARRLREDAQKLLADYQRKHAEAEQEAAAIIAQAKHEAAAMAEETRNGLAASLERRTKLAEDKIARAESQAVSEVRSAAVDSAIRTAETLLRSKTGGGTGEKLIDSGIAELAGKFSRAN